MNCHITLFSVIALAILATCGISSAQEEHRPPEPTKLTLSPAAEPTPAMKHELLPPFLDRREGNAVPLYMKTLLMLNDSGIDNKSWEKISVWLETPPNELPRKEVRAALEPLNSVYGDLQLAARRDRCDWSIAIRERGPAIFGTLLPEVQGFRSLGRLLALKARSEIAEGKYDEAIQTLQIGYTLSRHVTEQPFIVSGLVGVAIANQMSQQLEQLLTAKDSPNMYWAIAALPDPLIDARPAMELEGSTLFLMYPELNELESKELTPLQWRKLWRRYFIETAGLVNELDGQDQPDFGDAVKQLARVAMADALLESRYPAAKKNLTAIGYDEKVVEAMPKAQVVLLSEVATFKRRRDETFKWAHVPYWKAEKHLNKIEAQLRERAGKGAKDKFETGSIADLILPSMNAAIQAYRSADHRLAALRTIEAIRMYAAGHDGKLPAALRDIEVVPIPINPYTGQPAIYELDAEKAVATLTMPSPRADRTLVYELRIAK